MKKRETSAPAEGTSSKANASTDTQAAANVVSEGGNEVQENGGNKEDDGSHEVDGNNITRWPEDQVQQPPEDFTISTDPELWGAITDHVREAAISQGPAAFQNRAPKYPASVRDIGIGGKTRPLTNDLLHCCLPNNEVVSREWLIYSPSAGMVYCFACKLLSSQRNAFTSGFSDWRHPERISDHEKSANHRHSMLTLLHRTKNVGTVDASLRRQRDAEGKYWKDVFRRIVAVIKFLSEKGLPFRGNDEHLCSSSNGNYLGLLELIAQFDPFLREH